MSTPLSSVPYVEPWLRGTHADVPAVGRAVLHALDLALDDLTKWTEGLTDAEFMRSRWGCLRWHSICGISRVRRIAF